jgi:hypothetical protein
VPALERDTSKATGTSTALRAETKARALAPHRNRPQAAAALVRKEQVNTDRTLPGQVPVKDGIR